MVPLNSDPRLAVINHQRLRRLVVGRSFGPPARGCFGLDIEKRFREIDNLRGARFGRQANQLSRCVEKGPLWATVVFRRTPHTNRR